MSTYTLLEDLGGTAQEVGASLLMKGCKGLPGTFTDCPVAVYLQKEWGQTRTPKDFRWGVDGTVADDGFVAVPLPQPVKDFIHSYDAGNYPELRLKQSDVELKA